LRRTFRDRLPADDYRTRVERTQLVQLTPANLVGQSDTHLCSAEHAAIIGAPIHVAAVAPLLALRSDAATAGFDLAVLSGFRSFERQLSIWNRKAVGLLPVLDSAARPLDVNAMTGAEIVFAILRWSALPGASRHHWGSDMDVYDRGATPDGYEVELVPAEVDAGGMFAPFHEWLDARITAGAAHRFFRPYDRDRGGIAPERWHLSYSPVATECAGLLTRDLLRTTIERIERADMQLKDPVLAHLDEIFDRFVINVKSAAG
jgi:LAS superfamily LD-carboxypeptidase LdcB